ncbi:DUF6221 family protein [Streptacidiphilus carbonis]|uniref:DUF6221 family protein n=1 Tax=Streptacidiphilus carbonis TaxID=105422 RepID=UPI0005AAD4EE|nr:DUF6221 family protein [Streptacidiphilus carbonis]
MQGYAGAGELVAFVAARLVEAEAQAELFHELTCTVVTALGEGPPRLDGRPRCRCPARAQLVARAHALQRVLRDCEQRIHQDDPQDPSWPLGPIFAEVSVRALALPYELHPQWREEWRPVR